MLRRMIVGSFLFFFAIPVMAATISITKLTPNPGGAANRLDWEGKYTLGAGETIAGQGSILCHATLKGSQPPQLTTRGATPNQVLQTWTCTMQLAPATYTCNATLSYYDANGANQTASSPSQDVTVQ